MRTSLLVVLFSIFIVVFLPAINIGYNPETLKSKKVIVTGASTGIGAEIALYHCSHGSEVVILARNEKRMQNVVETCSTVGGKGYYLKVDFNSVSEEYFSDVIEKAVKLLGGSLDTIYLNHILSSGTFEVDGFYDKLDLKHAVKMFNVNYFSHVGLAHFAIKHLEKTKGRMVVVGSAAGRTAVSNVAMYSGSKHALFGYFESLRIDFYKKQSNISITTCTIGSIGTENALTNTKGQIPDFMWQSPSECAKAIVVGGELRKRDVFFPLSQTLPVFLLRPFPHLLDFIATQLN